MPLLTPVYYREADGNQPVEAFMAHLSPTLQARFDYKLERLQGLSTQRPFLPEPHSSPLDDELWALDCPCNGEAEHYVAIYAIYGTYCVVLHAYERRGSSADSEPTEIARERWEDCLNRITSNSDPPPFGTPIP